MRYLYNLLLYVLFPYIILRLLWKSRKNPSYRKRWLERFGRYKTQEIRNSIWIHAVSLGESNAAIPLIKKLQKQYPENQIVVTNMTPTGSARIQNVFGNEVINVYVPYDYPCSIMRFLNHFMPKIAIIMETEIWPNILYHCAKRNIPIIMANARLSPHSFESYKKLGKIFSGLLNKISLIAAQSSLDKNRFLSLGVNSKKVIIAGNIKFDINIPNNLFNDAKILRKKLGKNRLIWIAASTHTGEEEIILQAHKKIKKTFSNALLILVPRHPERFGEVTELGKKNNFNVIRYTKNDICIDKTDVLIGDTIGKLLLFYASSDVAFVGGSLITKVGGHNLLEPAAVGIPIISGNNLFNFVDIDKLLTEANALIKISNVDQLADTVIKLFQDKNLREQKIKVGLNVINQNKGAVDKIMHELLYHSLPCVPL